MGSEGTIDPDALVSFRRTPFGPTQAYFKYERGAVDLGPITKKLRGYAPSAAAATTGRSCSCATTDRLRRCSRRSGGSWESACSPPRWAGSRKARSWTIQTAGPITARKLPSAGARRGQGRASMIWDDVHGGKPELSAMRGKARPFSRGLAGWVPAPLSRSSHPPGNR